LLSYSWADPNVLFGPYDFSVNIDKLTPECKGGRGRDDGKPVNATVDQTAIYTEQQQGGGGTRRFGSNAKPSNRRTQNTQNIDSGGGSFQYPDYTKDIPCEFFESCHRNFPNSKTCNTHKFKEGLIYRAHTSGAQGMNHLFSVNNFMITLQFHAILLILSKYILQSVVGHCRTLSQLLLPIQRRG